MKSQPITKCVSLATGVLWIEFASAHGGLSSLGAFDDIGKAVFKIIVLSWIVWISATYLFYRSKSSKGVGLRNFLYSLIALICIAPNLILAFIGYDFFGPAICLPVGIGGIILAGLSVLAVKHVRDNALERLDSRTE